MILIFGGAYQGKTDYAKSEFNIEKVWDCSGGTPDFTADCICGIENFVMDCVKNGVEAREYFREHREEWNRADGIDGPEKVFVITDTSQGVVPVDADVRAAREMNGRLMIYLAEEASEVHRVFCGIGRRIK